MLVSHFPLLLRSIRLACAAPKMIGDFVFTNITFGRDPDIDKQLRILKDDASTTLFFYYGYRRYWDKLRFGRSGASEFGPGFPNVPFNAGHLRAAENFIKQHFGTANALTVFHWRSEHVDEEMLVRVFALFMSCLTMRWGLASMETSHILHQLAYLPPLLYVFYSVCAHVTTHPQEPCAGQLAELIGKFAWPTTPSGARALLLSDMAAPNHRHILVRGIKHPSPVVRMSRLRSTLS